MVRPLAAIAMAALAGCAAPGGERSAETRYELPRVDVTTLLSPPPADEGAQRDLAAVRAAERSRTPEQSADAEENSVVDVFLFRSVLGPRFTAERVPRTAAFFRRVLGAALPYLEETKVCWGRPRPFVVDPTLMPLERSFASTRRRQPAPGAPAVPRPVPSAGSPCIASPVESPYSPSYPSGHATVGAMNAILLARMVPERRDALFERGWAHGDARVISGVHFPSDVEAGRILGTLLVGLLDEDPRFRADLDAARLELRRALGLAAAR